MTEFFYNIFFRPPFKNVQNFSLRKKFNNIYILLVHISDFTLLLITSLVNEDSL